MLFCVTVLGQSRADSVEKSHYELAILAIDAWMANNKTATGLELLIDAKETYKTTSGLSQNLQTKFPLKPFPAHTAAVSDIAFRVANDDGKLSVAKYLKETYNKYVSHSVKKIKTTDIDKLIAKYSAPSAITVREVAVAPSTSSLDKKIESLQNQLDAIDKIYKDINLKVPKIEDVKKYDKIAEDMSSLLATHSTLSGKVSKLTTKSGGNDFNKEHQKLIREISNLSDAAVKLNKAVDEALSGSKIVKEEGTVDTEYSPGPEPKPKVSIWYYILPLIVLVVIGLLYYYRKKILTTLNGQNMTNQQSSNAGNNLNPELNPVSGNLPFAKKENTLKVETSIGVNLIKRTEIPIPQGQIIWKIFGASVRGNSHIKMNLPCQDNHYIEDLGMAGQWQ